MVRGQTIKICMEQLNNHMGSSVQDFTPTHRQELLHSYEVIAGNNDKKITATTNKKLPYLKDSK